MSQERVTIVGQDAKKNTSQSELESIKARVAKLEAALDEKDRELREMSILRGEYLEQLNTIRNLLNRTSIRPNLQAILNSRQKQSKLEVMESKPIETLSNDSIKDETISNLEIKPEDSEKLQLPHKLDSEDIMLTDERTYRERMILMNRIDIYRLFVTVIIISSEIKYPRILSSVEERELKMFIEELNDFENMLLDLKVNPNMIWEKGKTCEKQILQLFTNFFKV